MYVVNGRLNAEDRVNLDDEVNRMAVMVGEALACQELELKDALDLGFGGMTIVVQVIGPNSPDPLYERAANVVQAIEMVEVGDLDR